MSRRRLQALFDNTLDAILLADDQARYVDANHAACTLLGYDREELLRRGVFDITPMPNGEAGRAAWAAFVRDGQQSGEYALNRKDGTTAVVEYRAVANVQPGLHLSVLRDVTERRRTEEALRASERRFKTLTGSAPVGIFETDAQGNCLFVNDRWCEMAGMTPGQARGEGWVAALHPEDRDRIFREWYAAAGGGREFTAEYRFRTPAGHVTWLAGSAVALRDEAGTITGYLGTVTDISERKRAEVALRESEERLRAIIDNSPSVIFVKGAGGPLPAGEQGVRGVLRGTPGADDREVRQRLPAPGVRRPLPGRRPAGVADRAGGPLRGGGPTPRPDGDGPDGEVPAARRERPALRGLRHCDRHYRVEAGGQRPPRERRAFTGHQ